jgi:hypothetical protein
MLLAELDGRPIAGIFLLQWRNVAYYKFNASVDQHYRPNDLLIWEAILFGREHGMTMLDFGLSDSEQQGLIRYKQKFATEEREISFLRWIPQGNRYSHTDGAGDLLDHMTRLFTDPSVPDEITWKAGEKLYRFFV